MKTTEEKVIEWAKERNLLTQDNAKNQILKTMEELGEVARAELKQDQLGIIDGVGDVLVCLAIYANQRDLDLSTCFDAAYNEIKNRKGKTVKGIFIKD